MLTGSVKNKLYKAFVEHEGSVPHMYLDSENHVTVGIGHLLIDVAAAQLVTFYNAANKQASKSEIKVDFDKFPEAAQQALFDMIFNLGMTKLRRKFPKLNKAVKAQDWVTAAKHSHRKSPISAERNRYVKNLFLKAARQAKAANAKP